MTTARHHEVARTTTADADLGLFLLAGILTVLVTRWFLVRTGYPKLGGGGTGLHIAHILWGGLLMATGIVLLLALDGQRIRMWAALAGGVGFGLFIDEIGKVVSDGGGYLYRPAAGLIYAAFAVLAVVRRRLARRTPLAGPAAARTRTTRAADAALTGVVHGLTDRRRRAALALLDGSTREVDRALAHLLECVETAPQAPRRHPPGPGRIAAAAWARVSGPVRALASRWREAALAREPASGARGAAPVTAVSARVRDAVGALGGHRVTVPAVAVCAVLHAGLLLFGFCADLATGELRHESQWGAVGGLVTCATVTLGLAVTGALRLRRDRAAGLALLRTSLLVDLLPGQAFNFVVNQFSAVTNWLLALALLTIVSGELDRARHHPGAPARLGAAGADTGLEATGG